MNGWFTNIPANWPPSADINPLFVSFHLNAKATGTILNKPSNIEYFKKYEPIGCRDNYTAESLKLKGIDAYFSGCLTLTLGDLYPSAKKTKKIYIVDPYFKGSKKIKDIFNAAALYMRKPLVLLRISKGLYHSVNFKSLLLTGQYYRIYSQLFSKDIIENAEYIQHQNHEIAALEDDAARYNYADSLLRKYSEAGLVITGRIHCALPSIGMGTKVVFTIRSTDNEESTCRYGGLKDLFNVAYISSDSSYVQTESGLIKKHIDSIDDIPVVSKYKSYKQSLIERCRSFVKL